MLTSIPVQNFVDPAPGSRAHNAIVRAIERNPDVVKIGQHGWERYYRIQCPKRNRHLVILWTDQHGDALAKCDCEAHYIPQEPTECVHVAAALIWESQNNGKRPRAQRKKGAVPADRSGKGADQKQRQRRRRV